MSKIKPLTNQIVTVAVEGETKTASGVLLESPLEEYNVVVATGPDVKSVKKGDRVLFAETDAVHIQLADAAHIVVSEDKVIATLVFVD
jgi:co-chaperonin GroES (HSP10)